MSVVYAYFDETHVWLEGYDQRAAWWERAREAPAVFMSTSTVDMPFEVTECPRRYGSTNR